MCEYQGCHFGATYEDAKCIDGFLWDLDSGGIDENGETFLDAGGSLPCPKCNASSYMRSQADDFINDGYESYDHPLTTKEVKNVMSKLPSNQRRIGMRYWRAGRTMAIKEAMQEG